MGRDKALIEVEGQAAWQYQLKKLQACRLDRFFISVREARDWTLPEGVEWLPDLRERCGPLGGLDAALALRDVERVLLLGVDMPRLPAEFLQSVLDFVDSGCGVGVHNGEFFEPLCSLYTCAMKTDVEAAMRDGRYGFQALMRNWITSGRMQQKDCQAEARQSLFLNVNGRL